jgi:hypothetical protein
VVKSQNIFLLRIEAFEGIGEEVDLAWVVEGFA